jgi:hypothetical protein
VLTERARQALREAARADAPDERFRLAHLAALRTAGAVIAAHGRPGGRRRLQSAWLLVHSLAPEYAEWAVYFAAGARDRAAIEAGARAVVSARAADDQLRSAEQFLRLVEEPLGRIAVPLAS